MEREKQVPLFDVPAGSGELPPLKLLDPAEEAKVAYNKETLETLSRLLERSCSTSTSRRRWWQCTPGR